METPEQSVKYVQSWKYVLMARSLVVSDLRLETNFPGSSPAGIYVQRWAPGSNRPANV